MTRIEKIELLKKVKAGRLSLTKHRTKWWSQDWINSSLFHCDGGALYSTTICPALGIPTDPTGEVFKHLLYYHKDFQFNGSVHLINQLDLEEEKNDFIVIGKLALYRQHRVTTLGDRFGLYEPNERFDSGFIF